ncbi:MAG: LPS assembly lipoprotein LptE [Ferruginibacter sp.]
MQQSNSTFKISSSAIILSLLFFVTLISGCATCKYSTRDTSVPPEVKTFRVNYFENKATYVNPQLSPQLTEKLKQKIIGTTRLRQTNDDDAHYDISGYVSAYYASTTGISGSNASTNRLTVSFHLIFKNNLAISEDKKIVESDITTNVDFPATQSLAEAETSRNTEIINNVVGEIFNKIFSNW